MSKIMLKAPTGAFLHIFLSRIKGQTVLMGHMACKTSDGFRGVLLDATPFMPSLMFSQLF